jgi:lipoate---protein ligase
MLCINLENTDPCFCLAAEEYLLKNYREDIFMLWQSDQTVVVGKHQNTLGEIDFRYVRENGIRVARRISGGGTVFHDRGNVNFTFIKNVSGPHEISFKRFTQPIVDILSTWGIEAVTSGRNDLLADGRKISGNAEHVYKNRVLHHGTLLYDSDLNNLGNAIRVIPGKYQSKAVQSNRSVVVNISEFLINPPPVAEFIRKILDFQLNNESGNQIHRFSPEENTLINRLAEEKFRTWEWIYGYSPGYQFSHHCNWNGKELQLSFTVDRNRIGNLELNGNVYTGQERDALLSRIPGSLHEFGALTAIHTLLGIPHDDALIYTWF